LDVKGWDINSKEKQKKQTPTRKNGNSFHASISSKLLTFDGRNLIRSPNTGTENIANIIKAIRRQTSQIQRAVLDVEKS
jgi:hypothetical protein